MHGSWDRPDLLTCQIKYTCRITCIFWVTFSSSSSSSFSPPPPAMHSKSPYAIKQVSLSQRPIRLTLVIHTRNNCTSCWKDWSWKTKWTYKLCSPNFSRIWTAVLWNQKQMCYQWATLTPYLTDDNNLPEHIGSVLLLFFWSWSDHGRAHIGTGRHVGLEDHGTNWVKS